MKNLLQCGKGLYLRRMLSVPALLACLSTTIALGANDITGTARNQSRGQPAVGDVVILLRLDRGAQEEGRTKTNAQGEFILRVQHPDKPYLVRVVHQHVSYDQHASAGDVLSVPVFDAASWVRGMTGSIEILRTGTRGNLLHVSDMYEVKNESRPPLTLASEHAFEAYLPANAKIDSVLAAGPGKIGVMISAAPVPGKPGHYTVSFPLRPGATKFAFNYDLPYDGHAAFQTWHEYPLQQLAVMIPPTMKFSSRSSAFEILATGNSNYQVQAANQLNAGEGPEFEVSGAGALPPLRDQAKSEARLQPPGLPNPKESARGRAVSPSLASIGPRLEQARSSSESFSLGAVGAVLLAACALLVWRARKSHSVSAAKAVASQAYKTERSAILLEALRQELSQLESDRLRGSISEREYASTKQALEETARRAVAKAG